MSLALYTLALSAYTLAFVCRLLDERLPGVARISGPALWVGFTAHLAGIAALGARLGTVPLRSPSGSITCISALVIAGFLWTRRNPRAEAVGRFVVPLAIVLQAAALFLPGESAGEGLTAGSLWFPVHAAMMLLGLGGFALAFGVSALYLLVRRRLKHKKLDHLNRLPSLETLDRLNTRFVVLGFAALTVGIAVGGIWAASMPERPVMGPTVYGSLITWLWYAAAIQVRVVGGWRGRLAAGFSVLGFLGLVITLLVTATIVSGWHT